MAYTVSSSEQQKRLTGQAKDRATAEAADARTTALAQKATLEKTQQRNLDISNERRRISAPLAAVTSSGSAPVSSVSPSTSPATVTRGQTTLLGA